MSMGGNLSRISNPQMNADERRGGMILNAPMCWFVLAVCGVGWAAAAAADDVVALRQQYNQVSASIDTLVRLYGGDKLRELAKRKDNSRLLPTNSKLVLIFWADDEAELFLNGHRIGETRLTPTRIEIPVVYLRKSNVLRAHCWDTDRVESGFMAGLYLQDGRGRLRKVLATGDGRWWVDSQRAEPRFYNHSLPDIPGAEVIWGTKLFGEVELEARFDAAQLARAARRRPLASSAHAASRQPMETHLVVSRLVHLQKQRDELARKLHARRSSAQDVLYEGFVRGRLAFSLGKASRLAEVESIDAAKKLLAWTEALPAAQRELVFPKKQALKGVGHVVPQRTVVGAVSGETDRRRDYAPPAARGSTQGEGRATGSGVQEPSARGVRSVRSTPWALWGIATGLLLYLGAVSRQWWKLLSAKGWTS